MLWLPVTFVPTVGWLSVWKKIVGDFFSSHIGSECRFVIKRGHIFPIPFRAKFIHLYTITKMQKSRVLWKLRALSRCHGYDLWISLRGQNDLGWFRQPWAYLCCNMHKMSITSDFKIEMGSNSFENYENKINLGHSINEGPCEHLWHPCMLRF